MELSLLNGISASDLGTLLSYFEEVQPLINCEINDKQDPTARSPSEVVESSDSLVVHNVVGKDLSDTTLTIKDANKHENDLSDPTLGNEHCVNQFSVQSTKCGMSANKESLSESSWTDDSSSDCSEHCSSGKIASPQYRGRGCNFGKNKKGGGSSFYGRGRSQGTLFCSDTSHHQTAPGSPEFYDKLPTYYTALSRPVRGIVRSIHLNPSELEIFDEIQPSYEHPILDKIPAYQSCFTNSTLYDNKFNGINFSLLRDEESEKADHFNCENRKRRRRQMHKSRSAKNRSKSRGRSRSSGKSQGRSRTNKMPQKAHETDERTESTPVHNETVQKSCSKNSKSLERRIVYIGRIPRKFTKSELIELFGRFGSIAECSLHFRESGDNYGFVNYETSDGSAKAVESNFLWRNLTYFSSRSKLSLLIAIEDGNKLPGCENWDICFGGRRKFCRNDYTDLDGNMQVIEEYVPGVMKTPLSFDELLRETVRSRK